MSIMFTFVKSISFSLCSWERMSLELQTPIHAIWWHVCATHRPHAQSFSACGNRPINTRTNAMEHFSICVCRTRHTTFACSSKWRVSNNKSTSCHRERCSLLHCIFDGYSNDMSGVIDRQIKRLLTLEFYMKKWSWKDYWLSSLIPKRWSWKDYWLSSFVWKNEVEKITYSRLLYQRDDVEMITDSRVLYKRDKVELPKVSWHASRSLDV